LQLTSDRSSSQCAPVGPSSGWWNDMENDICRPPSRPAVAGCGLTKRWEDDTGRGCWGRSTCDEELGMSGWLGALVLAVGLLVGTWALLVLLARRLPPGLLRDMAGFVPDCVTTVRRLRGDPRVPRRAKLVVALAGLWLLSPIDLLPEFLPVIGPLDDVLVVALALRYAARQVPREVLVAAWLGEPRLLERLLGSPNLASS
jgi:uncharacterized membrane protein YkvA (DUF1232 family)